MRLPRLTGARLLCGGICFGLVLIAGSVRAATTETFVPTIIDFPGASTTSARGINNSGDIVGTYVCSVAAGCTLTGPAASAGSHGFLLQDGVYTRVDVPDGTGTVARGISEQGVIIGHYNVSGVTHGFSYRDGEYHLPDRRAGKPFRQSVFHRATHPSGADLPAGRHRRVLPRRHPNHDDDAWVAAQKRHLYSACDATLCRGYDEPRPGHHEQRHRAHR